MGEATTYYCMKCGEVLVKKPTGQCPSCQCPYDLDNNITYTLIPRGNGLEAALSTCAGSFMATFLYAGIVFFVVTALTDLFAIAMVSLALVFFFLVTWVLSLKISRLTSLLAFSIGCAWGPTLAAITVLASRGEFIHGMVDHYPIIGVGFSLILFVVLLPAWATRQFLVARWRSQRLQELADPGTTQ